MVMAAKYSSCNKCNMSSTKGNPSYRKVVINNSVKRTKRRRDSLEVFFFLTSGVYLVTIGLPLFLRPSFDAVGEYAAKVLLGQHKQKLYIKKHVHHKNHYLRPNKVDDISKRRVVHLDDTANHGTSYSTNAHNIVLDSSQSLQYEEDADRNVDNRGIDQTDNIDECVPIAEWQSMSFPTCNMFHETDLFSSSNLPSHVGRRYAANHINFSSYYRQNDEIDAAQTQVDTHAAKLLGNGWFRNAWKVANIDQDYSVAMKTLR